MSVKFTPERERLSPVLPSDSSRYANQTCVEVHHTIVPAGAHLSANGPTPAYLDQDWQFYTHPEGKPYSSRGAAPTLITEARVTDAQVARQLEAWANFIADLVREAGLKFHAGVELFLEPDTEDGTCNYYFVDHDTRAVFYLESHDTEELGLPKTFSEQHLHHLLEQNYWTHVEMFCMHLNSLPHNALEDLISIFLHGQIDHMTSASSTFPYSKAECADFIKTLESSRSLLHNPTTFVGIARLWAHVASNRYLTHYGEEHCRLDRTTRILEPKPERASRVLRAISRVFFRLPEAVQEKLDDQFVDDLVTKHQWSSFVRNQLADWQSSMQWTLALLLGNALSIPTAYSTVLAHSSMLLCATGLLVGAGLCVRHQDLVDADAPDAANFLSEQQTSSGFQRLAVLYTMPRAIFIWALVLFIVQMSCIILSPLPRPFGILAGMVLSGVAMAVFKAFNPRYRLSYALPRISLPFFHREKGAEAVV